MLVFSQQIHHVTSIFSPPLLASLAMDVLKHIIDKYGNTLTMFSQLCPMMAVLTTWNKSCIDQKGNTITSKLTQTSHE